MIYNGSRFPRLVHLPAGEWVAVVAGKQAGVTPVTDLPSHYTGQVTVPAFSAMVLYNPDA
ncbi:MAG: hypothetical protein IMX01_09380 [Limnochordaceae bacterium]|nr:hypothetical protein [Limnochordaceae bacterium]